MLQRRKASACRRTGRRDGPEGSPSTFCSSGRAKHLFDGAVAERLKVFGIDIRQQRLRATPQNRTDAGEEAEGRRDNGVARADVGRSQREPERVGPARASNGMRYGAGGGGGLLEAGDLRARE